MWYQQLRGLLYILILSTAATVAAVSPQMNQQQVASDWTWPLDGTFAVRINGKYGTTVENTDYAVRNLDLIHPSIDHITCFDVGWHRIYHAGVDLYSLNGSTMNTTVRSIANGKIVYASASEEVVVIEHLLSNGAKVYSSYWHLQLEQNIATGANVTKGTKLGEVVFQQYSGRYPEFHPGGDDSHLHFEIRTFKDGGGLFPPGSRCNTGYLPGVGYTYPYSPNAYGYLDPLDFLRQRISSLKIYLPLTSKVNPSTCVSGQNLAQNAGFEGSIANPQPWLEVTTAVDFVYHFVKDNINAYYSGVHGAMLGDAEAAQGYGIIDEELIQSFVVPVNVNSITWKQKLKLDRVPRGTTVVDPGDRFILSVKDAQTGVPLPILADIVIDHTANYSYNQWVDRTVIIQGLAPYSGRLISISYSNLSDGDQVLSAMWIDNVEFNTTCSSQ